MDSSKQDDQNIPVLCHICHTFYGTKVTNYLCSSCHRDEQNYNKIDSQKNLSLNKVDLSANTNTTITATIEQQQPKNFNEGGANIIDGAVATGVKSPQKENNKQEETPVVKLEEKPVEQQQPEFPKQTNRSACWTCKKKVGLLGFTCKCDYVFCGKHRYAEEHHCHFDYKTQHQEKLWLENPQCKVDKLNRI